MYSASLTLRFISMTCAIYDFHILEIKRMLFENGMLSSGRHVKSSILGCVLLDAYARSASRFSNV